MLRVDFMFADSTTDFILVIFKDSSLLIGGMTIALKNFTICEKLDLDMLALPKQRKKTAHLGDFYRSTGSTDEATWQTPKQYQHHHFFGVIDLLVTKTESKFNQDTLEYLSSIEDLLLQSANGESPAVTSDLKTQRFTPWHHKADIRGLSESEIAIQ